MTTGNGTPFDAAKAAGAMQVEHCDIPAEMTISEWRSHCAAEQRAANEAGRSARGVLRRAFGRG